MDCENKIETDIEIDREDKYGKGKVKGKGKGNGNYANNNTISNSDTNNEIDGNKQIDSYNEIDNKDTTINNQNTKLPFLYRKIQRKKLNTTLKHQQFIIERDNLLSTLNEQQKTQYWDMQASRRKELNNAKLLSKERLFNAYNKKPSFIIDFTYIYNNIKWLPSLISQLKYAIGHCKKFNNPLGLIFTNVNGDVAKTLEINHSTNWRVKIHDNDLLSNYNIPDLIYLSPDSPNVMTDIEDKYYIIGGIIDPIVKTNLSLTRANELGLRTMRLPLDHLNSRCKVLNVDTVIHLMQYRYNYPDNGWEDAINNTLPKREKLNPLKSKKPKHNNEISIDTADTSICLNNQEEKEDYSMN